jgi:ATP-binding cassette, subfamily B, bacterial PglK
MNFQYLNEILFLIGKNNRKLPLMGLLFIFSSLLDIAGIGLIGPYVSLISNSDQFLQSSFYEIYQGLGFSTELSDLVIIVGILLILVFVTKTIAAILINSVILKFCHNQSVELRALLMHCYQSLPYIEYVQRNSSGYIHNISLADKFATGTLLSFLRLISDGIVVIAIVVFLGMNDIVTLSLLTFILLSLAIIYDKIYKPKVALYGVLANKSSIQILKSIQEAIIGLKEVRVLQKEYFFYSSMLVAAKKFADVSVKTSMVNHAPRFLIELVMVSFVVFYIFLAQYTGKSYSDLLPLLSMFGIASLKLVPATSSIISGMSKMRFHRDAVNLIYKDVFKLKNTTVPKGIEVIRDTNNFDSLFLKNIEFSYPNTKHSAIRNLSIKINKADVIGFMGPSGSGKTTLINIILGLLHPQKGEIFYNGQLINKESLAECSSQAAYLPQEVFLMDDTLEKNVALGVFENEIDKDKVSEAIKKAMLVDLVADLPLGVETIIGERGAKISGGQKQRIALARAFYHEREILVMDESTSALDNETEQQVVEEISRLKGKKTMIVIAHRLSTLLYCDRIYQLEDGQIVKQVNYKDLVDM